MRRLLCGTFASCWAVLWVLAGSQAGAAQPASAASSPADDPDRVVATVLGEPIYAFELVPPPSTQPQAATRPGMDSVPSQVDRELARRILKPLRERFIRENNLEPTPEELETAAEGCRRRQQQNRERQREEMAKVNEQLAMEGLDASRREKLERQKAGLQRTAEIQRDIDDRWPQLRTTLAAQVEVLRRQHAELKVAVQAQPADSPEGRRMRASLKDLEEFIQTSEASMRGLPERMAHFLVGPWKFNRALHRKYGGTVVWQQAGTEAVGALKAFLEEREKAGDFQIKDPALREAFWDRFRQEPTAFVINKPDPFAVAPWEEQLETSRPTASSSKPAVER